MNKQNIYRTNNKDGKKVKMPSVMNLLFAFCLTSLIIGAVFFSFFNNEKINPSFFGVSCYSIITSSMEPAYPVGSLVLTRRVDTNELRVGDDITLLIEDGEKSFFLTHRIVEITNDNNALFFKTKGLSSRTADKMLFEEKNIVGKVFLCIPGLGRIMSFIKQIWFFVLLVVIGIVALIAFLKSRAIDIRDKKKLILKVDQ